MHRVVLFAAVLAVGLAAAPARAAQPSPATVNLHLGDLPTGFTIDTDEMVNDAQLAKINKQSLAQIQQTGRLLSNAEGFTRSALTGLVYIGSQTILYVSPAAARAAFTNNAKTGPFNKGTKDIKQMSLGPVGERSVGLANTPTSNGYHVTIYAAVFQRGRYLCMIGTSGFTGTFTADSLLTLSRIVDSRIQKNR